MADDETPLHRGCGTMQVHRRLLDTDPGYARRLARIEEHAFRAQMGFTALRPGCTEIPVVVHVVYRTAAQNISVAQIESQIEVLNRDFRKQNADAGTVPAPFSPLAGDARLQFRLANVDPDGNPTDGVTRTQTDKASFDSSDEVKFAASGGHDAWPTDEYLNIWVCQLAGGLLGYAQFPGGPAATDGVVITHTGFGTTGTATAPFDKGRTTVHEIGHWLNLRHIWGDDGAGCSGSDFVADTPNQGGPNVGKPSFPTISCGNAPNGDMFMNFMDYVDDDTMVMFTEGQIARMQACLDGPRSAIGASVSCTGGPGGPEPKTIVKDAPKDPLKDTAKDAPKDGFKEPVKEQPKEFAKDPVNDPPKSIFEPPKGLGDPPKTTLEPPFGLPTPGPAIQPPVATPPAPPPYLPPPVAPSYPSPSVAPPYAPPSFWPFQFQLPSLQSILPFVLGTGGPQAHAAMPTAPQPAAEVQRHYAMILALYAGLYQRGLLDPQGLAAWQQAWAAYRQGGGQ